MPFKGARHLQYVSFSRSKMNRNVIFWKQLFSPKTTWRKNLIGNPSVFLYSGMSRDEKGSSQNPTRSILFFSNSYSAKKFKFGIQIVFFFQELTRRKIFDSKSLAFFFNSETGTQYFFFRIWFYHWFSRFSLCYYMCY